PASAAVRARGYLILVLPDGREGERLAIPDDGMRVGRELGGIFAADPYLSPVHAQLAFQGDRVMVEDLASVNGVFVCLPRQVPTALSDGDIFRIGQELVRFEAFSANASTDENDVERMGSPNPGYAGRICLLYGPNEVGNAFCVPAEGLHLGRERGDLLFPEDGYVSGLHCRIQPKDDGAELTDLGSSNGTFLRIQAPTAVAPGGLLLIGQQLFRVEY
ncbi:MAG: FHA domain-containing protein, partial [Polyangiales bacterium]